MIQLRFVTTDTSSISRMIQFSQYGFWASHVEAVMPDGALLGAHVEDGVQSRPSTYDTKQFTRQLFVELPADDAMTETFHKFLKEQIGKPYDKTAIAAF